MLRILLKHFLLAFLLEELFVRIVVEHTVLREHIAITAQIAFAILSVWGLWTFLKIREFKRREPMS
jgi:hypothetical protein